MYWIDTDLIGANVQHKYIIDINNEQLYDYEGEYFSKKRWHTLQFGVDEETLSSSIETDSEMWDGWITLTLYYPSGATEKMWRLGQEGETRSDDNLTWEYYTGPITVRLSQVENIWIKYKINGETVIIPPLGKLLVDIEVSPTGGKQESVNIKINFDSNAETRQYKINGGSWQDYNGEFTVTENVLIEAKGTKTEYVYDSDGNLITTRTITGTDSYFIRNIGTETVIETIPAPVIERLETTQEGEVARVKITYPDNAIEKIYKINYGTKQNYTDEISITEYKTVVTAYYKTSEGTSLYARLYIDGEDDSGSTNISETYKPYEENASIPEPTETLAGPIIKINSTGEQATITVTTAEVARKIYIKLGNQSYQEYTEPFTVSTNMTVSAYYISYVEGITSKTSYARVTGLNQGEKPSVVIDADPYPYGNNDIVDKVTVTITTDASIAEYSFDGSVYQTYTGELEITSNCRIYARATNDYGTTVEYLDITNLSNTAPAKKENLSVSITVTPEPKLTTTLTDNATVSITYDEKATGKYYSIGKYGTLQEYTESFTVTENCTIYAYATSSNGVGQAVKIIDNITTGIAEPVIEGDPSNNQGTTKTKISITFDSTAKTTRYEINGDGLRDYTGEFEVEENCIIRAVNTNSLGQTSESTYRVENIVATAPPLLLDKGDYYILKLPFPEGSTNQEYKYKEDGIWKSYPSDGILFIKPEKKDEVLSNDKIKIKIEDENGNEINFNGDWYLLDVPISELFEYISMRWDRVQASSPNIILNTTEPAREVSVSILYSSTILEKQYKIVYPDGTQTDWQEYKAPFTVDQKGTIIYARGIDDAEVYSKEAILQVTNIDEESPVIELTADLENTQQKVGVKVVVTDDTKVETIKWASGNLGESYFINNGTAIINNSVVNLTENGIYTFYAVDSVGNTQIYTLTVTNIDNTPPQIDIEASPDTIGLESTITIDYGDSNTKEYKIGEGTTTWTTYTEPFTITSYDVISAGTMNSDYTVTVYARGVDSAGNEIIESKKILNLDLDAPKTPVISSNYGYPILTEYGVQFDGETTISYDSRKDITNYYSVDGGTTWNVYTGTFEYIQSGTIYAKSVKNSSGLESIATKTVTQPSDALGVAAYDGDESTYYTIERGKTRKILVSNEMRGKKMYCSFNVTHISTNYYPCINFYDSDGTLLEQYSYSVTGNQQLTYTIPNDTSYITFYCKHWNTTSYYSTMDIYEVMPTNEAIITKTQYYPKLMSYGVEAGYCIATISYDSTSVQKLYKIDNGQWQTYQNKAIKLELGQVLYAKGIDKNGKETKIISSYTATLPSGAVGANAYDGNEDTYVQIRNTTKKIYVDETMIGKNVYFSIYASSYGSLYYGYINFCKSDGTVISTPINTASTHNAWKQSYSGTYVIPNDTAYIEFVSISNSSGNYVQIKEIKPVS